MPTRCISESFVFSSVEGRRVVAGFDRGAVTSDAGALLLGAADRAIGLIDRFAARFANVPAATEHGGTVTTLADHARVRPSSGEDGFPEEK